MSDNKFNSQIQVKTSSLNVEFCNQQLILSSQAEIYG